MSYRSFKRDVITERYLIREIIRHAVFTCFFDDHSDEFFFLELLVGRGYTIRFFDGESAYYRFYHTKLPFLKRKNMFWLEQEIGHIS
jgi:hypothetical protein